MSFVPIMLVIAGCFGVLLLVSALLYVFAAMTYEAYHDREIPAVIAFSGIWLILLSAGLYQLYIYMG